MYKFYDAWQYLNNNRIFKDKYSESRFLQCLDIYVTKVNPETREIDDDEIKNTEVEVWLECGKHHPNMRIHDVDLDCGENTFEEAIIELAKLVKEKYED